MALAAWGPGLFDNEHAEQWLKDLYDTEDLQSILLAMAAVLEFQGTEELDPADCCCALVAAELVAAGAGQPGADFPLQAKEFVRQQKLAVAGNVLEMAARVVELVKGSQSVFTTYKAMGVLTEWLNAVENLEARLNKATPADG